MNKKMLTAILFLCGAISEGNAGTYYIQTIGTKVPVSITAASIKRTFKGKDAGLLKLDYKKVMKGTRFTVKDKTPKTRKRIAKLLKIDPKLGAKAKAKAAKKAGFELLYDKKNLNKIKVNLQALTGTSLSYNIFREFVKLETKANRKETKKEYDITRTYKATRKSTPKKPVLLEIASVKDLTATSISQPYIIKAKSLVSITLKTANGKTTTFNMRDTAGDEPEEDDDDSSTKKVGSSKYVTFVLSDDGAKVISWTISDKTYRSKIN